MWLLTPLLQKYKIYQLSQSYLLIFIWWVTLFVNSGRHLDSVNLLFHQRYVYWQIYQNLFINWCDKWCNITRFVNNLIASKKKIMNYKEWLKLTNNIITYQYYVNL